MQWVSAVSFRVTAIKLHGTEISFGSIVANIENYIQITQSNSEKVTSSH